MPTAYQILNVKPSATVAEIKRAFKKKAHKLHPDVNKAPNAEEKWIELYEAYELLLHLKHHRKRKNHRPKSATSATYKTKTYTKQELRDKAVKRARKRAYAHAKMKFEAYKKTAYYQNELALEVIGDNLMFYFALSVVLGCWYMSLYSDSSLLLVIGFFVAATAYPLWRSALKPTSNVKVSKLVKAVYKILKTNVFSLLTLAGCNVLLYLLYAVNTYCNVYVSFGLLLTSIFVGFLLVKQNLVFKHSIYSRSIAAYVVFPLLVNLFFATNYLFAGAPSTQMYSYTCRNIVTNYRNGKSIEQNSLIDIPELEQYQGIRFFWNHKTKRASGKAKITSAEGLFGIRVVLEKSLIVENKFNKNTKGLSP